MEKILIIGASGQIGTELAIALRRKHGRNNIIASDRKKPKEKLLQSGPFEYVDANDIDRINRVVEEYDIDIIYHMAAILSVLGEEDIQLTWHVNTDSLLNVLKVALRYSMVRVFWPSSIAVFSPEVPRVNTPQDATLIPRTMYGVTKASGELLCNYYFHRFGLDVRSIRYPGIISSETLPGGGTTDYAVEIFYEAIKKKRYTCFLREDTVLPMMYIVDCINAAVKLMEADPLKIRRHTGYNVSSMSFSPRELSAEIRKHIPEFECEYRPDPRQVIADSWPMSIDDSVARQDWEWRPMYDLASVTQDMLEKLKKRFDEDSL
jgi:nucleoside-diphosphate-sugar epimerase